MPRATKAKPSTSSRSRSSAASTRSRGRRSKKNTITVDFEGVETGGGKPIADGTHLMYPSKIEEKEGQDSGEPYLNWTWKVNGGKADGAIAYDTTSLQPQALWRLRTILECLGYEVPDGPMDIDYESIAEEKPRCLVEIVNEEYENRDRPRAVGFLPAEEGETGDMDVEEEEEKPTRRSRSSRSQKMKVGSKVKFYDDEEEQDIKGVITEIDGSEATVEDSEGAEWEVNLSELSAA